MAAVVMSLPIVSSPVGSRNMNGESNGDRRCEERYACSSTTKSFGLTPRYEIGQLQWDAERSCDPAVEVTMNRVGTLLELPKRRTALISAIEINSSGTQLATGGVQKTVRIFNIASIVEKDGATTMDASELSSSCEDRKDSETSCSAAKQNGKGDYARTTNDILLSCEFMNPAKISGLAWGGIGGDSILGCVDYDGIFSRFDIARATTLSEGDSHGGRRIWSVRYRNGTSTLGGKYITASEDGTCALWEGNYGDAVMRVTPHQTGFHRPSVCCADFLKQDQPLVVMALSDSSVQICDLRYTGCVGGFYAHCGAVSSLKICGDTMVTSSVDSTAALWNVGESICHPKLNRRFKCHFNRRNFVGLSLRRDGFVACGSEQGEFVVYHKNWDEPVTRESLDYYKPVNDLEVPSKSETLVSALCWHPDERTGLLFAGSSAGGLHVYRQNSQTNCLNVC